MSLRGTKQSPIVGGDCFGKNALAMTFAKKAERTYLEDYNKIKVLKRRCCGLSNIAHLFQRLFLDLEGYRLFANHPQI
jgi:hypothetical protein